MQLRPSLAGAVVALLAMPAGATAAPFFKTPLKKCYVSAAQDQTENIFVDAGGFEGSALVDIFIDNAKIAVPPDSDPPQAGIDGNLSGMVRAPFIASGQRSFSLRLAEQSNPAWSVTAVSKVTALSVTASPSRARTTSSRVRFRGRGFTKPLEPVYAHYVFRGKVRHTVRIGKPAGDCGQFSVRRRQFPFKHPHVGKWMVQFDQERAYNPNAQAYSRLKIVVSRKPGSRK